MVDLGFRLLWTVFGKISLYCYIKELDYILPFWSCSDSLNTKSVLTDIYKRLHQFL